MVPQSTALVSVTDPLGYPLGLALGLPAAVTLPLGANCVPPVTEPSVQPEWTWDVSGGVWRITGQFSCQIDGGGAVSFVGPVLQLGLLAVGAAAETTEVTVAPDRTLNIPFQLRLSSQADPVLIEEDISRRKFTVPRNKEVTVEVLSPKESPGNYYTNPNDTNTLRPLKDKTVILRVKKTFTEATEDLPLSLSTHIPNLKRNGLTLNTDEAEHHFLTFRSTGKQDGGNQGVGNTYYGAIANYRVNASKFADWLDKTGFLKAGDPYPAKYKEDASALYFNATDLGFGRSMHMRITPGADGKTNIAYYVINYRNLEDALSDKADSIPELGRIAVATVAMDYAYDPVRSNRVTKFYVFDPGLFGNLRTEADLDGGGNKFTPNLCINCHGSKPLNVTSIRGRPGQFTLSPPNGDVGGHFIPFDLQAFTYSPKVGVQQAQFRALNRGIYLYTPLTPAMKELIEGWYGGPLTNGNNNNFQTAFIPTGWNTKAALYRDAVSVSCRGCHTMRDTTGGGKNIALNSYDSLDGVSSSAESLVCRSLLMPNAQRTFTIFWGSHAANVIKPGAVPDQPKLLQTEFNWGACPTPPP
jgi:hypothetical protein